MAYEHGDLLLATIVFPDASGAKKRPVLVIHDFGDSDLLVAPVTTHPPRSPEDVTVREWQQAGLRLPSTARMSKLATVAKTTIVRQLGHLAGVDQQATLGVFRRLLQTFVAHG